MMLQVHTEAIALQLSEVYAAMAVSMLLNRTLVMPQVTNCLFCWVYLKGNKDASKTLQ